MKLLSFFKLTWAQRSDRTESVFSVKYVLLDVRPLFGHVEKCVHRHLGAPALIGFDPRVGNRWIVTVASRRSRSSSPDLGKLKVLCPASVLVITSRLMA
jgi:hypothetical protein